MGGGGHRSRTTARRAVTGAGERSSRCPNAVGGQGLRSVLMARAGGAVSRSRPPSRGRAAPAPPGVWRASRARLLSSWRCPPPDSGCARRRTRGARAPRRPSPGQLAAGWRASFACRGDGLRRQPGDLHAVPEADRPGLPSLGHGGLSRRRLQELRLELGAGRSARRTVRATCRRCASSWSAPRPSPSASGLLQLLVEPGGLPHVVAQALAVAAAMPITFAGNKLWTFA